MTQSKNTIGWFMETYTVWKVTKSKVPSCPYFSVFGPDTEINRVNLRFQSECGNIRTRKNFVFSHHSHSVICIDQTGLYNFSRAREFKIKIFNITSKYFRILNNTPPATNTPPASLVICKSKGFSYSSMLYITVDY